MSTIPIYDSHTLSISTQHQRERTINYLQSVGNELNRFSADKILNICHLGARIKELKQRGWIFSTIRKPAHDLFGRLHPNIAHYRLKGFQVTLNREWRDSVQLVLHLSNDGLDRQKLEVIQD